MALTSTNKYKNTIADLLSRISAASDIIAAKVAGMNLKIPVTLDDMPTTKTTVGSIVSSESPIEDVAAALNGLSIKNGEVAGGAISSYTLNGVDYTKVAIDSAGYYTNNNEITTDAKYLTFTNNATSTEVTLTGTSNVQVADNSFYTIAQGYYPLDVKVNISGSLDIGDSILLVDGPSLNGNKYEISVATSPGYTSGDSDKITLNKFTGTSTTKPAAANFDSTISITPSSTNDLYIQPNTYFEKGIQINKIDGIKTGTTESAITAAGNVYTNKSDVKKFLVSLGESGYYTKNSTLYTDINAYTGDLSITLNITKDGNDTYVCTSGALPTGYYDNATITYDVSEIADSASARVFNVYDSPNTVTTISSSTGSLEVPANYDFQTARKYSVQDAEVNPITANFNPETQRVTFGGGTLKTAGWLGSAIALPETIDIGEGSHTIGDFKKNPTSGSAGYVSSVSSGHYYISCESTAGYIAEGTIYKDLGFGEGSASLGSITKNNGSSNITKGDVSIPSKNYYVELSGNTGYLSSAPSSAVLIGSPITVEASATNNSGTSLETDINSLTIYFTVSGNYLESTGTYKATVKSGSMSAVTYSGPTAESNIITLVGGECTDAGWISSHVTKPETIPLTLATSTAVSSSNSVLWKNASNTPTPEFTITPGAETKYIPKETWTGKGIAIAAVSSGTGLIESKSSTGFIGIEDIAAGNNLEYTPSNDKDSGTPSYFSSILVNVDDIIDKLSKI